MPQIVLDPGNPHDFADEELRALGERLRREDESIEIRIVRRPERGYGVTFLEVLFIWIALTGAVKGTLEAAKAIHTAAEWAQERWRRYRADHPGRTPRACLLVFCDADGLVIQKVRIGDPNGEIVEEGDDDERRPPPAFTAE